MVHGDNKITYTQEDLARVGYSGYRAILHALCKMAKWFHALCQIGTWSKLNTRLLLGDMLLHAESQTSIMHVTWYVAFLCKLKASIMHVIWYMVFFFFFFFL